MKMEKRKLILLLSIVALISFLFMFYFDVLEPHGPMPPDWFRENYRQIPVNRLLLSPLLLTLAVIAISYYFISRRLEAKLEKNLTVISKLVNKNNLASKTKPTEMNNKKIILKFLNLNERKVLEKLLERKGTMLQSEISRMEGMTKLKTHRAVKDLEIKGVIKTESYGKTNRIILAKDVKEIMLNKV